jgi:secondary thiamine-phosphate synthase enzyme
MLTKIRIHTEPGEGIQDITTQVNRALEVEKITEGLCLLFLPHTTAGLALNSALDPDTLKDIRSELHRLVPTRVDFHHTYDTPSDAAGHIKAVLVGNSLSLLISEGKLLLGGSQSVLLCEFDGPRNREIWMRLIEDS